MRKCTSSGSCRRRACFELYRACIKQKVEVAGAKGRPLAAILEATSSLWESNCSKSKDTERPAVTSEMRPITCRSVFEFVLIDNEFDEKLVMA